MDIQIRAFFTTFTSRCIQAADCTKMDDALIKARSLVAEQEPMIDSFLDKFVKEWEVTEHGLTITTKPIIHELYIDKREDQQRIYSSDFIHKKRENKYDIGSAIIHIPLESLAPLIRFENRDFVHGHINDGRISCWGEYENIQRCVLKGGPLTALTSMFAFCKYSRYGSHTLEEKMAHV